MLRAALMAFVIALCAPAKAQPKEERTDGPWGLAAVGISHVVGEYEWVGPPEPGYGLSGEIELSGDISGFGGTVVGAFGHRIGVIGFGLGIDGTAASAGGARIGESTFDALVAATLSLVGILRSQRGVFGAVWVGGARYSFIGGTDHIGSAVNVVDPTDALYGASFSLGGGKLWDGIGVLGRLTHVRVSHEHATFNAWLVTAGAAFAAW